MLPSVIVIRDELSPFASAHRLLTPKKALSSQKCWTVFKDKTSVPFSGSSTAKIFVIHIYLSHTLQESFKLPELLSGGCNSSRKQVNGGGKEVLFVFPCQGLRLRGKYGNIPNCF